MKGEHVYLNDYHRQRSEAAQKEVAEMLKHPLSHEQVKEQIARRKKAAIEDAYKELSHIPDLQAKLDVIVAYLSENRGTLKKANEIQTATGIEITEDEFEEMIRLLMHQKKINQRGYNIEIWDKE